MAGTKEAKRKTIDGLPVIDATEPLEIHILGRDIKHAIAKTSDCCAAARAICRENEDILEAHVYPTKTFVKKKRVVIRYMTPLMLRLETHSLDRNGIAMPGTFTLRPPSPCQRLGAHAGGKKKTPSGRAPRPKHVVQAIRPTAPKGRGASEFK